VPAVHIALGIVFFWFGILKLFPGLSPGRIDPDPRANGDGRPEVAGQRDVRPRGGRPG
jgi:hypothetical protein